VLKHYTICLLGPDGKELHRRGVEAEDEKALIEEVDTMADLFNKLTKR